MPILLLCLVALVQATPAVPAAAPVASADSVAYHFENERFLISKIDLEVDASGRGRLVFVRKGLAKPVSCDVVVADEVVREIDGLLARLGYLASGEDYQTEKDHSNLGEVAITVVRSATRREARFNFTANRDMAAVQSLLRGIANREIFVFDLETAAQFQPLETPRLLQALGDEIANGHVTGVEALLPLLRRFADDVSLPLIARNRAAGLAEKLEKAKSQP